jgi:polyphosphate kinase 2 (PPK2 family)
VPKQIRDLLRAKVEDGRFRLAEVDPASTPGRIRRRLPEAGDVGIFNRSHFNVIERRYDLINRFEKQVTSQRTKIVKICLHISYDEQRKRLIERLKDPDKQWKFSEHDIDERGYWDDYQSAYSIAIARCSTRWAPWYVIPANDKDYRNWAVSRILIETLDEMNPSIPIPGSTCRSF